MNTKSYTLTMNKICIQAPKIIREVALAALYGFANHRVC